MGQNSQGQAGPAAMGPGGGGMMPGGPPQQLPNGLIRRPPPMGSMNPPTMQGQPPWLPQGSPLPPPGGPPPGGGGQPGGQPWYADMMNQRNTQSGNLVHERELERQAALAKQIEQEQLLAELEEARRHRGMQSMGGDDGGGDGGGDE